MKRTTPALLLLLAALAAAAAYGEVVGVAFGTSGQLFELHSGTYGALFPQGTQVEPQHPVLALDVTHQGVRSRHLVPGTEGEEVEGSTSLVLESESEHLFLLWESKVDPVLSALNLSSFGDGEWAPVIEVSGDPMALRQPPSLAITRDGYGAAFTAQRTVVHLVWWEETATGDEVFYTPIVLVNGEFLGWNPVVALSQFASPAAAVAPSLLQAATVEPGRDIRSVVAALPLAATGRLLTLEMRVLPHALLQLADEARAHVPGFGRHLEYRTNEALADEIRDFLIASSGELHDGVLAYLASETHAAILALGTTFAEEELDAIADAVRGQVIDAGASIVGHELEPIARAGCQLLHLGASPAAPITASLHEIEICPISERPLPQIGVGPVTLVVSEDARDALVFWEPGPSELHYVLSEGADWGSAHSVSLGAGLDVEAAKAYLRQLIRTD